MTGGILILQVAVMIAALAVGVLAESPVACRFPGSTHEFWREGDSSGKVQAQATRYPAHWFAPVPKEGAPAWEILPQEAGPGEVILSKRK
jgi:hypothetical protein